MLIRPREYRFEVDGQKYCLRVDRLMWWKATDLFPKYKVHPRLLKAGKEGWRADIEQKIKEEVPISVKDTLTWIVLCFKSGLKKRFGK